MSKDSEPESRPISVSELLARSQAAGGTTPTRRDGRGRRRAGRDGSVSVSDLTGEIPKITDAPAAQADDKPAPVNEKPANEKAAAPAEPAAVETPEVETPRDEVDEVDQPETEAPEAASAPEPSTPGPATEPSVPEPTETPEPETSGPESAAPRAWGPAGWSGTESPDGPFPRSGNPVARRAADDRPVADRFRPDRPFSASGRNASGMPGYGEAPPATRDFSSDSVARRMSPPRDSAPVDEESANAVTGIIPQFLADREVMLKDADDLIVTADMHERKRLMFEKSDAFVAMPGGIGTLEEVVEMMTWAQLGQHDKPIALLDVGGFWRPLVDLLDHMRAEAFIRPGYELRYEVVAEVADLLPRLEAAHGAAAAGKEDAALLRRMCGAAPP